MDSQVTLVDPDIPSRSLLDDVCTVLDLERDVITSTVITMRGSSDTRYKVQTKTRGFSRLGVRLVISENDNVIATIHRRDMFPDKISFEGSTTINVNKWLRWSKGSSFPASIEDWGQRFAWHVGPGERLALRSESNNTEIAWFNPSRLRFGNTSSESGSQAYLALAAPAEVMRTKVLVSCILVVQKMRANQRIWNTAAESTTWTGFSAMMGTLGGV
ncbi:hypothetical protein J3A83DRAFT_411952 [Scleroderma citrinum]